MRVLPAELYDGIERLAIQHGGVGMGARSYSCRPLCLLGIADALDTEAGCGLRHSAAIAVAFGSDGDAWYANDRCVQRYLLDTGWQRTESVSPWWIGGRMPWPLYRAAMGLIRGEEHDAVPLMSSEVETAPEAVAV